MQVHNFFTYFNLPQLVPLSFSVKWCYRFHFVKFTIMASLQGSLNMVLSDASPELDKPIISGRYII